jgi:hypothetical protein
LPPSLTVIRQQVLLGDLIIGPYAEESVYKSPGPTSIFPCTCNLAWGAKEASPIPTVELLKNMLSFMARQSPEEVPNR